MCKIADSRRTCRRRGRRRSTSPSVTPTSRSSSNCPNCSATRPSAWGVRAVVRVPLVAADLVDGALAEPDDVEGIKADLGVPGRWRGSPWRSSPLMSIETAWIDALCGAELVEERLQRRRCCGRARTTRSRRVSWSTTDGQVALAAAIGDLVDADRDQAASRRSSRWSATTRSTIRPTCPTRSAAAGDRRNLAICCASHATTSSRSRVCARRAAPTAPAPAARRRSGQRSRRSSHSITQRLAPRSRWRQRLTRRSWICRWRPVCPQPRAHASPAAQPHASRSPPRRREQTSMTDAPGRRSMRLNAVCDAHAVLLAGR